MFSALLDVTDRNWSRRPDTQIVSNNTETMTLQLMCVTVKGEMEEPRPPEPFKGQKREIIKQLKHQDGWI